MPLLVAPIGAELTVVKITADEKTKRHLENLGIIVGGSIKSLSGGSGNIIVGIKNSRFAIDSGLALKIHVNV
ncbi:MAG: ferrous iron transport protein A [Christensenellaceae bacterium]|jgi:ferrous iron transport protein A|nr:ferrous iron transport protein A [Christensenellaceae bacterium]